MSAPFNDQEKLLLNNNKLPHFYPNSELLEKYLIDESKTGNSNFTIALFTTENGKFVLPITSRQYGERTVSELYHSEFFKTQYSGINRITHIQDLRDPSVLWKPILINNSRAILNIDSQSADKILNSKRDIKYHIKNHGLHESNSDIDGNLIKIAVDRFNIENLGNITNEYVEHDLWLSKNDSTRRYFSLSNKNNEQRSILELQIEISNSGLVIHYINAYYIKDLKSKIEKTGLNSYYSVVKLACKVAQELGFSKLTIDFGLIFRFPYKLKIPGSILGGSTMILVKEFPGI